MKKLATLVVVLLVIVILQGTLVAKTQSDYKNYVNVEFTDGSNFDNQIVPLVEKEEEYKDKWYSDAPTGTASFTFSTDSGHNRLNVFFDNKSHVGVILTLYKKSGWFGKWQVVNSIEISGNSSDYFQVVPDSDVKYKAEVSNRTGDKILGTMRVRSYNE